MKRQTFALALVLLLVFGLSCACQFRSSAKPGTVGLKSTLISADESILASANEHSPVPTPTGSRPQALPVSPVATPIRPDIPTPEASTGTVYGALVEPATGLPSVNLPVYLGTYDGTLAEVSLEKSPRTFTDSSGYFIFLDVPPNDNSFQYVVGIVVGGSGTILKSPTSRKALVFSVAAGQVVDLGVLENSLP